MELTMPNGMSLTQEFEPQRDLLTAMLYKRGTTGVVERHYTYDSLGRPLTRSESRKGSTRNDAFTHNDRSELTAATLGNAAYSYAYDNIGNRKTAQENAEDATAYTTNNLNQYTAVGEFAPEFDADGNQTKVQTSSGIWNVTYNAENRPTVFSRENEDGTTTRVTCAYDYMGRRATKKVETITTDVETEESTASTTLNQRYLYRGYLQVACCDLARSAHPCLWLITWDPTQPVATRPLAIQKDATWYVYGWDLTKNICEVFSNSGIIKTTYSYTPYGAVTASGTVVQPIQWSSEFCDGELGLVYYNYRHYNSADGRWLSSDPMVEFYNLYVFCANKSYTNDFLGLLTQQERNKLRVANTIEVGVSLEWWDDDGGPGGQAGTLSIGQQDDFLVATGISARAVCQCGKFEIIDGNLWEDEGEKGFWWGSVSYKTAIKTSRDLEDAGAFVFYSELDSKGDGGFLTSIIIAAIAGATAPFSAGIVVAAVALASDISMRIAQGIASNDKNKWLTTAILSCEDKDTLYSKPKVTWGAILPKNIGFRETARFNGVGYEHYVPKFERYVK